MSKISCDIILDLMPLVKDGVASEESELLVRDHLETCEVCKGLYDSLDTEEIVMNEKNIIKNMKKRILMGSIFLIIIASMVGLALSETMGMFYNILIMPAIGVIGYFALDEKAYFVPTSLFVFSYIWLLIKYIAEGMFGETPIFTAITIPILWAGIYTGLCVLGVIVGFLLKYAFGKEKNYEV